MKNIFKKLLPIGFIAFVVVMILLLTGCGSTKYLITYYDDNGKITKTEQGERSGVAEITEATKNKFVCVWHNGWAAYIKAQLASVEDPTPTGKIYAGQVNGGYMSFDPSKANGLQWDGIAKVITATNRDLKVDMTGVSSGSSSSTGTADTKATAASTNKADTAQATGTSETKATTQ